MDPVWHPLDLADCTLEPTARRGGVESSHDSPLEGTGFELLVRGRGEAGCRAFDAPSYLGRVGSRRSDPANRDRRSREQIPVAVFRVGRSIFDATRHVGVFVVAVAPAKAMVLSPSVVYRAALVRSAAVRFFDANGSGRLIPSACGCAPSPDLPDPADSKSTAKPTYGIRKGSAKSWGLMTVAVTVSQDRIQPVGRLFIA